MFQALNSFGAQPGTPAVLWGGALKICRRVVGVIEGGNQLQNLLASDPDEGAVLRLGWVIPSGLESWIPGFEEGVDIDVWIYVRYESLIVTLHSLCHDHPSSSFIILHHPSSSFIILHHPSSSFIILHHPPSSFIILHHPSSSFIILHHPSSSFIILHHPSSSFIILHHPSSSFIILHHPSSSFIILHHPSSSFIILHHHHHHHHHHHGLYIVPASTIIFGALSVTKKGCPMLLWMSGAKVQLRKCRQIVRKRIHSAKEKPKNVEVCQQHKMSP